MQIRLLVSVLMVMGVLLVRAQAPGTPVYADAPTSAENKQLSDSLARLRDSGDSLADQDVRQQLLRTSCQLELSPPQTQRLTAREVWARARRSHVRLGWSYQCDKCPQWHLTLAGGYVISTNGAVATSYHVVEPPRDLREGSLVAADDSGKAYAVKEILAANRYSDTCIVRIAGNDLVPLALSTNVVPGDAVYCFSDPLGRRGYFSQGIVNRFYQLPGQRQAKVPGAPLIAPVRISVSVDWAVGSSGSAVLDEFGNAIGHVSTISGGGEMEKNEADAERVRSAMVFRDAVTARDVLALVQATR